MTKEAELISFISKQMIKEKNNKKTFECIKESTFLIKNVHKNVKVVTN